MPLIQCPRLFTHHIRFVISSGPSMMQVVSGRSTSDRQRHHRPNARFQKPIHPIQNGQSVGNQRHHIRKKSLCNCRYRFVPLLVRLPFLLAWRETSFLLSVLFRRSKSLLFLFPSSLRLLSMSGREFVDVGLNIALIGLRRVSA